MKEESLIIRIDQDLKKELQVMADNDSRTLSNFVRLHLEELAGIDNENNMENGKNPFAVELGRLGGLKGGKARADSLTSERKSEIAKKAATTRWENKDSKTEPPKVIIPQSYHNDESEKELLTIQVMFPLYRLAKVRLEDMAGSWIVGKIDWITNQGDMGLSVDAANWNDHDGYYEVHEWGKSHNQVNGIKIKHLQLLLYPPAEAPQTIKKKVYDLGTSRHYGNQRILIDTPISLLYAIHNSIDMFNLIESGIALNRNDYYDGDNPIKK